MHNDYTLLLRKYPNGKKVYFYYAYDDDGRRRGAWTTKSTTKTEARNYVNKLIKKGMLIPDRKKALTFGEYATGFWEKGSEYVEYRNSRADISLSYVDGCRSITEKHLLPFFADVPLEKITADDVNKWLLGFSKREVIEDGEKKIKRYQNTFANTVLRTFKTMMSEAMRRGLVTVNPCLNVPFLKNDRRDIEIFTVEEVRKLFPENYQTVWGKREIAFIANKLAAVSGMRSAEILGLRGEFVFDSHILVCGQYSRHGYVPHTKTKHNRNIPIMPEMMALLRKLMEKNGKGFLFSYDGGATPLSHTNLSRGLREALGKIGIKDEEIKRRGLCLHSWRHFVNTELQRLGLTIQQVQSVTGHRTARMTEWYSHMDARQLDTVIEAQAAIVGTAQPKESKPSGGKVQKGKGKYNGLKIVKPEQTEEIIKKGA